MLWALTCLISVNPCELSTYLTMECNFSHAFRACPTPPWSGNVAGDWLQWISLLRWAHFLTVMTASFSVLLSWWWHESVEGFSMLVSVPDPKPTPAWIVCAVLRHVPNEVWNGDYFHIYIYIFHSPSQWKLCATGGTSTLSFLPQMPFLSGMWNDQ